jgi:hypothetical protein
MRFLSSKGEESARVSPFLILFGSFGVEAMDISELVVLKEDK